MPSYIKRGKTWTVIIELPKSGKDKRDRKWLSGFKTKKEAQNAAVEFLSNLNKGITVETSDLTLGEYLDKFLKDYAVHNVKHNTYLSYEDAIKNLKIYVGDIKLSKLQPQLIQTFLSEQLENTQKSPTTIRYYYTVLNISLNLAVKWKLLQNNPCINVSPPKKNETEILPLSQEEADRLLEVSKGKSLHLPIQFALKCGLRRGEILALKWDDIVENKIYIRHNLILIKNEVKLVEPKTKSGKRVIIMPDTLFEILGKEKEKQFKFKEQLGNEYYDPYDFVVCRDNGSYLRPDYITKRFKSLIRSNGFPKETRFHDLRHTHATLLLEAGVHPKVVQERLGHSKISMTLDTYSHVLPSMQEKAASEIEKIFRK